MRAGAGEGEVGMRKQGSRVEGRRDGSYSAQHSDTRREKTSTKRSMRAGLCNNRAGRIDELGQLSFWMAVSPCRSLRQRANG